MPRDRCGPRAPLLQVSHLVFLHALAARPLTARGRSLARRDWGEVFLRCVVRRYRGGGVSLHGRGARRQGGVFDMLKLEIAVDLRAIAVFGHACAAWSGGGRYVSCRPPLVCPVVTSRSQELRLLLYLANCCVFIFLSCCCVSPPSSSLIFPRCIWCW